MPGSPVRRSDAPDASTSEICKQLARVVLDFAKPVYLTPPATRGIGILVYKDPRNSRIDVPEYDLLVTESQVWVRTAERYKTPTDVVIMALDRFEDFLGLHTPTRWYKFSTGFGSLSKGLLRVELAYLRRRARRSRGKPCRPMLLGTVGLGALTAG